MYVWLSVGICLNVRLGECVCRSLCTWMLMRLYVWMCVQFCVSACECERVWMCEWVNVCICVSKCACEYICVWMLTWSVWMCVCVIASACVNVSCYEVNTEIGNNECLTNTGAKTSCIPKEDSSTFPYMTSNKGRRNEKSHRKKATNNE